jgi:aspartyl-tRNA(Asn)/glutamyl-tRNA(Gln) amidotransferase subunit C
MITLLYYTLFSHSSASAASSAPRSRFGQLRSMSISEQDMARVAELARIRLDAADVSDVTRRISGILTMIDQMQAVDTDAVLPMANPLDATQRLREDIIAETDRRAEFLAIAPASEDGLYLVPRVID